MRCSTCRMQDWQLLWTILVSTSKICFGNMDLSQKSASSVFPHVFQLNFLRVQNIQVANSWMKSTWPDSPHISIQDTTRRQPSTLQLTSPDCICWRVPDQEIQPQFHDSSLVKKLNSRLQLSVRLLLGSHLDIWTPIICLNGLQYCMESHYIYLIWTINPKSLEPNRPLSSKDLVQKIYTPPPKKKTEKQHPDAVVSIRHSGYIGPSRNATHQHGAQVITIHADHRSWLWQPWFTNAPCIAASLNPTRLKHGVMCAFCCLFFFGGGGGNLENKHYEIGSRIYMIMLRISVSFENTFNTYFLEEKDMIDLE